MRVGGQAAIVTGGGSGLGAETAGALARAGMRVGVIDLNEAAANEVAASISGVARACDVADGAGAEEAVAAISAAIGAPRLLVNCAGIGTAARIVGREGPMPLAAFERIVRVNLIGSFNLLRIAANSMSMLEPLDDGERGVIVNTASIAAFDGQVGQCGYAASKGGIVSLTLPAARELARFGIRVVTIAPGLFRTPLLESLPSEIQASLGESVPFPARLGEPSEFAALVLHIAANPMLNGEVIRLDGALRMAAR
jgi:NAD(P)-dependent dehydrogenase (short-subunit alcohol dehydrogenase family)